MQKEASVAQRGKSAKRAISLPQVERRFSDFASITSEWFWETDENLKFTFFSESVFEATGVPAAFHIGKTRRELAAPEEDAARWERHLRDMDERKPFKDFVYRRLGPDGTVQWMRTSGRPFYDDDGTFRGYRGVGSNVTAEVEARESARRSEQRFKDIAEVSFDLFWETDEEHRFSFVSDTDRVDAEVPIRQLFGRTRWEAAGGDPDTDPFWRAHLETLESHAPFRDFRYGRLDRNGKERHFSINGVPVFGESGEFKGYRGSATEITARLAANRAIHEANALLAAAVESLPELFVLWGKDDRLVLCNEQFRVLNADVIETTKPGTAFADHIRATIDNKLVPSAVGREEEYFNERMALHRSKKASIELERQNGTWLLISERATEVGVVGVSVDITKRKLAEEALRYSEDRLRAIVDNVVDGIVTFDENGVIQTVNPAAQRIFEYPDGDLLGRDLSALMRNPAEGAAEETVDAFLRGHYRSVAEMTLEVDGARANGETVPLEISCSEMQTQDGSSFVGIFRDISERKAVERLKNEFVSTVSHELRTPLTSVRGSLGLVTDGAAGDIPGKAMELVNIAYKNTERLIDLVNDILDMEKLELGRMAFDMRPLPLEALVREAVADNIGFAQEFGVNFSVDASDDAMTVRGDKGRLLQVMSNLLSNAAKFSPLGGAVDIAVFRHDGAARVAVTDRGAGVPEDFQSRVFERFAQAKSPEARRVGGTGLGLSISKSIVEAHGGAMGFDSEPDVATTFYFTLPLHPN